MLSTLPRLIGHRGAKESAPENTLASLREAARQGARWVEVDVMLTRDHQPVLIHDDTLNRTTSGFGPVPDLTLAELKRLDAGSWFDPRFASETVPTLEEALALIADLGLGLNLEIKPYPGQDVPTAEIAIATLKRLWPPDRPLLLSSFEVPCLEVARDLAPDIPRGYLLWEPPADWAAIADRVGAATLNVHQDRQTAESVAAYRATGRPVLAYTVNDPQRAQTLFGWGVAAVFTDAPGRLAASLGNGAAEENP
ncbi:glycerophosphoryl diester phosphodiesterase [Azospirillum rugosum]|uniref:Glycerophosphoryl diester phosphodiesterase n=1 Tax=Azospirillum rugosum TaxID=416170 RepID=A0ABS4SUV9_9PROT|nr:glycerophosphoryl diester phosphodiesterase [Azospirillum rugosum]MBP2295868.1 glycerophosphoryl diester phosphodiesterase [Azospirillum rugosum]MDQ0530125.1 glycerophosphoryl diester phosphodiesterase [Azospirillum rugosum]